MEEAKGEGVEVKEGGHFCGHRLAKMDGFCVWDDGGGDGRRCLEPVAGQTLPWAWQHWQCREGETLDKACGRHGNIGNAGKERLGVSGWF